MKGNCVEGSIKLICGMRVNHCSETEKMLNQVERRWSRMEWSRLSKSADRSRRQRQETCCIEIALERWSCRESSVVSVE